MKYATPAAFRTALERRLLTTAQEISVPVARLRKLVVFDRLMARLLVVAPDRWILKGALPLALPPPPPAWIAPHRRMAAAVDLDPDLSTGHRQSAAFLDPILAGTVSDGAQWEPKLSGWRPADQAEPEPVD